MAGKKAELKGNALLLDQIQADARYQANLDWGQPRAGHPEATVRAHLLELEENLAALRRRLRADEVDSLRVLIHVHDTFKPDARAGVPITHPRSHASLARSFLAEFTDDPVLLACVQFHDEPFALWQQFARKGFFSNDRFERLLTAIGDWHLFGAFLLIDGCTAGKTIEPLEWFLPLIGQKLDIGWTAEDARDLSRSAQRRLPR